VNNYQPPYRGQGQIGIPGLPFQPGGPPDGVPSPIAPTSPPPSFTPTQQFQAYAVDPGAIQGCLYRFTYIWLDGYQSFWFFPTFVGLRSVSGYRWTGYRWVYYGVDLRRIDSFQCF
jgi:hypothetical protein